MKPAKPRGKNARPVFSLPLSKIEHEKFKAAADRKHLPLATWIRMKCHEAAEKE